MHDILGEPDRVHKQNMEQLNAYDCHQNLRSQNITEYAHTHEVCVRPI